MSVLLPLSPRVAPQQRQSKGRRNLYPSFIFQLHPVALSRPCLLIVVSARVYIYIYIYICECVCECECECECEC